MNIERLRQETAADHAAVEGSLPLMGKDLRKEEYVAVLQRLYGIVAAWENRIERDAPGWLMPVFEQRRRTGLLERDLRFFEASPGIGVDSADELLPETKDESALLGAMYVMEGSTLGGQLIARHLENVLGLEPGVGDAYFRSHGDQTGARWKEFVEVLRTRIPDEKSDVAVASAKAMFRAFGDWLGGSTLAR